MFETVLVILLLILCCSSYGALYYFNKAKKGIKKIQFLEEKSEKELNKKLEERMKAFKDEVIKEYNEKLEKEREEMKKEADELYDSTKERIKDVIQTADDMVGKELKKIIDKNTLFFTCVCDPKTPIPCFIDFSLDEIQYTCPKCGGLYKVVIEANSILKGTSVNPEKIIELVENNIQKEKNNDGE